VGGTDAPQSVRHFSSIDAGRRCCHAG
jgi:hypothetical protein